MINDEQIKQLKKLGYEIGVAFVVARDSEDPDSPVDKPVYYARAEMATHYFAEPEAADALIAEGKPLTRKQHDAAAAKRAKEDARA